MVGDFVLRERIDEGGFGAVYRCEQPLLGREAVVKVLHKRLRRNEVVLQRFMREAQLASRLDHPYAAHIYAFGIDQADGLFWIAMEMVQGTTLNRWLRDRGPLPLEQFVPFFERVAEVVQSAHERGIVHRDLKPSNVMVIERAGRLLPKLLDFGVAKLLDDTVLPTAPNGTFRAGSPSVQLDHEESSSWVRPSEAATLTGTTAPPARAGLEHKLTNDDATVGSPPYMSPEQWSNAVTVGPASDLYALAIVAYEALTGRRPFNAANVADYVDLHCNAAVPPLGDGFSPAFDRLFQRALAKRPEHRWGTALELASAFRVASGFGVSSAADLPRLDEAVRDAWLADAPQPLAESITALDGARNAHQARDAALDLVRNLLRYLFAVALATRAQVREDRGELALLELVRAMRRRDLTDDERIRLLRMLVRPLATSRGAHPIPELVDLVAARADDGADGLDPILAILAATDHTGTEDVVRARLAQLIPELTLLLRRTAFVLDYVLIVPRNQEAERWTGLRRQVRAIAAVRAGEAVKDHPMLIDRDGRICVDLWPLVQSVAPTEGAAHELFLFDGRGRHGARLIAAPAGYAHHDPTVWEWVAARVIAEIEPNPELPGDDHPPYLGLTPYAAGDAARFVGREWEVDAFLNRMRQRPLQVVVGPSGAGKSSFVHAGVIPGLPPSARVITMRPGGAPLAALAARLTSENLAPAELRPLLETSPARVAQLVAQAAGGTTIVLVIDQLEEVFTLCGNGEERVQFAAAIAQLAASADAPIRVICAIRDDFLMQLDALVPLRAALSPALVLLGNPSREALVRIVVEPARRAGYTLSDPELAHDMVSVVADQPGALALLSFTASRLWELRDRRFHELTRKAYDAMGGVGGALGRHAEVTLEAFSPDEQVLVREVFRHLVTAEGTRALITAQELRQRLATPRAETVVDKLVAARLVSLSETDGEFHVEVIHDALFLAWPRLQQWVREDIDGARMRDQLRIAALGWHKQHRSAGLLWRGDALDDLERWLRRASPVVLSDRETSFVDASRRLSRRERRARRSLAVIAFAFVAAFSAFQYGAWQSRKANQLAETRLTQQYVERGRQALLTGKRAEAVIYLAQASKRGDRSTAVAFMLTRAAEPLQPEDIRLTSATGRMWSATYSPDGTRIVTTDDGGAQLWVAKTGQLQFTLPHDDTVYQAAFTVDGTRVATADIDGVVKIWDTATGALVRSFNRWQATGKRPSYHGLAFAPDGRWVAALDASNEMTDVWDVVAGIPLAQLRLPSTAGSRKIVASRDGTRLALAGGDGVEVLDTSTWTSTRRLAWPEVTNLTFDPAGRRLAIATATGDVLIWDVVSDTRVAQLQGVGQSIAQIAFSPDGAHLAAGTTDGVVRVWTTATNRLESDLKYHRGLILSVEFDRSSQLLVTTGTDGVVVVSDLATGIALSTFEGTQPFITAQFAPTEPRIIGASWDGTARIWAATPTYRRWTSPAIGGECASDESQDADRRFLAIDCKVRGTYVWDTAQNQLLARLPGASNPGGDFHAAFPAVSAAGDRAAIAIGTTVAVYELPSGKLLRTITHSGNVNAVAFAPAGHDLASASIDGAPQVTRDGLAPVAMPPIDGGIDVVGILANGRMIAAARDLSSPSTRGLIRIYDTFNATQVGEDVKLSIRVRAIRTTPDATRILLLPVNWKDAAPILWDVERRRMIRALEGHKGRVFSARFVSDGKAILTAGGDGTVKRWDAYDGHLVKSYSGSNFLLDAAMSPDGATIVGAGGDGFLYFWDTASSSPAWSLRAHKASVSGLHFEGRELVSRSFLGEISRWDLSPSLSPSILRRILDCLPARFDERVGDLVDQTHSVTLPAAPCD
jgi:WD40 repeat protein/serine/threonine protein kinase